MGRVNSVAEAKTKNDPPSTYHRDGEEGSRTVTEDQIQIDGEQTKTLVEEDQRGVEEESKTLIEEDQRGGEEESKTLSEDQKDVGESKTLIEDLNVTEEGEEEEQECVLCRYIKGGVCKDAFIKLERCWDEAMKNNKDETSKCKEARLMFNACMNDNPVYYEPILVLEAREMAKMLSELLNAEKEAILVGDAAVIARTLNGLQKDDAEPITVLPAEAAAIGKAFSELEAGKKKEKEAEGSKGNESDQQNQN
ncbi:PREDICTED: uncharacterized protein LOC104726323 [Camelina sativa]|uniref:Uncharacterized protein LOC104726323 n=1 Tax=Camelina sativa TaxID=90675 RepID=A0ABM1QNX4_CAMSA|nr:PREDICTED: uncharacterized protein LOC104726323 [Camelina sativa]